MMALRGLFLLATLTLAAFHLQAGVFGVFESFTQRNLHLLLVAGVVFSATLIDRDARPGVRGLVLASTVVLAIALVANLWHADHYLNRMAYVTPLSTASMLFAVGAIAALVVLATHLLGIAFGVIIVAFLAYAAFGHHLPGAFGHRGFSASWTLDHLFYTREGVFGIPLGVSATYIYLFVFFGAVLERCGGGKFFIDLAMALTGRTRGGPAKAAVVGSALMGTISGSAVANVVTSGAITIPLMKRNGYSPTFAGAVEAAASSGGQLMPPVMGATAFVIAEFVGRPYGEIALAALVPALLFYLGVFLSVHLEALRTDIKSGVAAMGMGEALRTGGLYLLPLAVIAYAVFVFSPMRAGLYGVGAVLLVAVVYAILRGGLLQFPRWLIDGAAAAGRAIAPVSIACAAAGITIGVLSLTGLGITINNGILAVAGQSLAAALVLTMVSSLILGMGLPTVAAYLVQVGVTIPALVRLGVDPVAAHLFVFYFAILGNVTPPVAIAAYAASSISGANPAATGWKAVAICTPAFIVPFMFALDPVLLLRGGVGEILLSLITASLGVAALAAAIIGYAFDRLSGPARLALAAAALLALHPAPLTDAAGLLLAAVTLAIARWFTRRAPYPPQGGPT
ncbi:MAG: TRAP transporter permease [Pseudomonadota bacterium]